MGTNGRRPPDERAPPVFTRRRAIGGILTAGLASAGAGGGAMALFTDTARSANNTVQNGSLSLGFDGSSSFDLTATLTPGQSIEGRVTLVNPGTIAGSLDVDVTYSENDASDNTHDVTADQVADQLHVDTLQYAGTTVSQFDGTTLFDLANRDVGTGESTPNDLVDLADPGTGADFVLGLTYVDPNDNSFADDGIDVTLTFDLNQYDTH